MFKITPTMFNEDRYTLYSGINEVVKIKKGIKEIGVNSFYDSETVKRIYLPDSVISIEHNAFESCINLFKIKLSKNLEIIGSSAFDNCRSLVNCDLPESLKIIGNKVFFGCEHLESVFIPKNVEKIGTDAFLLCRNLSRIDVDDKNEHYSSLDGVLYNKEKTILIKVPSNHKGKIVIPDTVIKIEDDAFCECQSLTAVAILKTVEKFGISIFSGCVKLEKIATFEDVKNLSDVLIIPESVKEISHGAFEDCCNLKEVYYQEGIETEIDSFTFIHCGKVPIVNMPESQKDFPDLCLDEY